MAANSVTAKSVAEKNSTEKNEGPQHSNTYNIFILVLTIYSLIIMVVQFILPLDSPTWQLVSVIDNLICVIFLADFFMNLAQTPVKRDYLIGRLGVFDLLGSVPTFGFFRFTGLLRLFRLARLFRLRRFADPENRALLKHEILHNRSQYALFLTVLSAVLVIATASIAVLWFETGSPDANITDGGDAVWWAVVTITTVGYGDKFPVTAGGRITAVFVMFSGVGIIGALASILASILVAPPDEKKEEPATPAEGASGPTATVAPVTVAKDSPALEQELAAMRAELTAMRQLMESGKAGSS